MPLVRPVVYDACMQRALNRGDILVRSEVVPATISTTAITVTGAQLAAGFVLRNPAAPATDTIESAANIIAALSSGIDGGKVQSGMSFRCRWLVTTANATTVAATANTGVTVTLGSIAASSWKDFLITVVAGNPQQTLAVNTTNASAVITGMTADQTKLLAIGMVVTNAVNGLQGTTIVGIQPGVGVTMSGNANATSTFPTAITFSPTVTVQGIGQGAI